MTLTVPNALGTARLSGLPRTATLLMPPRWKVSVGSVFDRLRGRKPDPSKYYLGASFTEARIRRLARDAGLDIGRIGSSGYGSLRLAALPVPARFASRFERYAERRRHEGPWQYLGNNLIVTVQKPVR